MLYDVGDATGENDGGIVFDVSGCGGAPVGSRAKEFVVNADCALDDPAWMDDESPAADMRLLLVDKNLEVIDP